MATSDRLQNDTSDSEEGPSILRGFTSAQSSLEGKPSPLTSLLTKTQVSYALFQRKDFGSLRCIVKCTYMTEQVQIKVVATLKFSSSTDPNSKFSPATTANSSTAVKERGGSYN